MPHSLKAIVFPHSVSMLGDKFPQSTGKLVKHGKDKPMQLTWRIRLSHNSNSPPTRIQCALCCGKKEIITNYRSPLMTIICSPTTHLMPPLDTFLSTDNDDKQHYNDDDLHWNYIPNKNGTPTWYKSIQLNGCIQMQPKQFPRLLTRDMVINSLSLKRLRPMTQKFLLAFVLNNK